MEALSVQSLVQKKDGEEIASMIVNAKIMLPVILSQEIVNVRKAG